MIEAARYTASGTIVMVLAGGEEVIVPDDMANRHRQMIAEWEALGNTIQPYAPPPPTLEDYEESIQNHIDAVAREKRYRHGDACATYVNSPTPQWAAEAQAFIAWRDAVWLYAYAELDKVMNGQREQPTIEEFLAELPEIQWPT